MAGESEQTLIRWLLTLVFWSVLTPPAALVTLPWTLLTGDGRFLYRVGMWMASMGMRLSGIQVRPEGLAKLDARRTYIFMSNHVSNLDPPVLLPLIPRRASVLVKKELFRIPVFGQAMRIARLVPVDRSSREKAIESLRSAAAVLRDGLNLMVFAEGTRSRDGRLLPFKKGPFHLAIETGTAIVPVTIVGTYEAQPKGRFAVRPGLVRVVFHEPAEPVQISEKQDLMELVRARIASALPE
jgi:1-acyl-sn-glycerol-3-phosphate acyltransferase